MKTTPEVLPKVLLNILFSVCLLLFLADCLKKLFYYCMQNVQTQPQPQSEPEPETTPTILYSAQIPLIIIDITKVPKKLKSRAAKALLLSGQDICQKYNATLISSKNTSISVYIPLSSIPNNENCEKAKKSESREERKKLCESSMDIVVAGVNDCVIRSLKRELKHQFDKIKLTCYIYL
jgi:hypothetical protein